MVRVGAVRVAGEGFRHPQQRALHRPLRLEPLAMGAKSGHPQARAHPAAAKRNGKSTSGRSCGSSMTPPGWPYARAWTARAPKAAAPGAAAFPRLFGGILRCGLCGGAVVKISATSYGCAARRDRGRLRVPWCSACNQAGRRGAARARPQHLESPAMLAQLEREAALLVDCSRKP